MKHILRKMTQFGWMMKNRTFGIIGLLFISVFVFCLSRYKGKPLKEYYESGRLKMIVETKGNQANGLSKYYYESGQLKDSVFYKSGKKNGFSYHYYESGQLKLKTNYLNGLEEGERVEYYEDGEYKYFIDFKKGVKHGEYISVYENGEKENVRLYHNDDWYYWEEWDTLGNVNVIHRKIFDYFKQRHHSIGRSFGC